MRIKEILREDAIVNNIKATTKENVIKELVSVIAATHKLDGLEGQMVENIIKRETLGSTGIGQGIAIPHCKVEGINEIYLAVGISKDGLDFKALDGELVYIFFMLVAPAGVAGPHLKALARISRLLRDEYFCRSLRNAVDVKNIYNIIISDDERV